MRSAVVALLLAVAIAGCGSDALECTAPSGSVATEGTFELTYVDEIAPFSSTSMRPRVVQNDNDSVDLWACQQRGEQMWIVEATVTRAADTDLPIPLSRQDADATISAVMTRYDQYRVVEEQVADLAGGRIGGALRALDSDAGELEFDAVLAEDYVDLERLPAVRSLTLDANLTW